MCIHVDFTPSGGFDPAVDRGPLLVGGLLRSRGIAAERGIDFAATCKNLAAPLERREQALSDQPTRHLLIFTDEIGDLFDPREEVVF
ncbi:hypothetical protein CDQ91_14370 [Sphingopyxis witflariensis]|uniref:Uncharacterized protein n=1 Tax=Sphingopyxis witflariensis TaxID=173675 RepID=A0A2D0ANC3_9SPHN|nr:hypothetical protein CDQ91_14370 [Sphingopyxis witflariensis]